MQEKVYKYRIKLTKLNELKFISHLDWQNLIIKSLRRTETKLALSEGFNPIPKVSFSPALPLFIESECEFVSFAALEPVKDNFVQNFENYTNENIKIVDFITLPDDGKRLQSLDILVQWAKYEAYEIPNKNEGIFNSEQLRYTIKNCLSLNDLFIKKISKKGIEKNINYKTSLYSFELKDDKLVFVLKTGQNEDIPSLRADEFIKAVFGLNKLFCIKRICFFDKEHKVL